MRNLYLLYGCPASGKSSFIKEHELEDLTIGYDIFRELFGTRTLGHHTRSGQPYGTRRVPAPVEKHVVEATHRALCDRMLAGQTIVFDATNLSTSNQTKLAKLATRHSYDTYLIDIQADQSYEVIRDHNLNRTAVVDESILRDLYEKGRAKTFSEHLTVIDQDTFRAHINQRLPQVVGERVVVVGDVHSCSQPLNKAITELDTPETQWVFVGDLFDRGPDPVGTYQVIKALGDRAHRVIGNHCDHLRHVNNNVAVGHHTDTRVTARTLAAAGIFAREQNAFINEGHAALTINIGAGQPWLVTHGGVSGITRMYLRSNAVTMVSDAECIYGYSTLAKTYQGKSDYDIEGIPLAGYQFHGHRNGAPGADSPLAQVRDYGAGPIVCLESGVAGGGDMSVAVLTADPTSDNGYDLAIHAYDDGVDPASLATASRATAKLTPANLFAQLNEAEEVKVKHLGNQVRPELDGIYACNFTNRAFREGNWTDAAIHARGLFIDPAKDRIVARGYEKFFHLDEAPGRTLQAWSDQTVTAYPVTMVKKFNGYLALACAIDGQLIIFSKSGPTDYADYARNLLSNQIGADGLTKLAAMLASSNTTAVFEVISDADPHPINEPGDNRLVLLDAIVNDVHFRTNDKVAHGIANRFGIQTPDVHGVAHNPDELHELLISARQRDDEGIVLIDAKGYRGKAKAAGYADRKALRGQLNRFWSGKTDQFTTTDDTAARLDKAGILTDIQRDRFTITRLDGTPTLDLAGVFDALEAYESN